MVERVTEAFFNWNIHSAEPVANEPPSEELPPDEHQPNEQASDGLSPPPASAYLIVQCGVDGLAGDPYATWNWDIDVEREGSMGWCVQRVIRWAEERGVKVVFLGGGESLY